MDAIATNVNQPRMLSVAGFVAAATANTGLITARTAVMAMADEVRHVSRRAQTRGSRASLTAVDAMGDAHDGEVQCAPPPKRARGAGECPPPVQKDASGDASRATDRSESPMNVDEGDDAHHGSKEESESGAAAADTGDGNSSSAGAPSAADSGDADGARSSRRKGETGTRRELL